MKLVNSLLHWSMIGVCISNVNILGRGYLKGLYGTKMIVQLIYTVVVFRLYQHSSLSWWWSGIFLKRRDGWRGGGLAE